MDELEDLIKVRRMVSIARESCAGSNVQNIPLVRFSLLTTIRCCKEKRIEEYIPILIDSWEQLGKVNEYGDRLPIDDALCSVITVIDHRIAGMKTCL